MATKTNLIVDQGATYSNTITVYSSNGSALNLSGYTGSAQLRKHYTSSNSVSFSITMGGNTGNITLALSANTTANLSSGRYVYDVEITNVSDGKITRVREGIVTVTPNVTR